MTHRILFMLLILLLFPLPLFAQPDYIHHDLKVTLSPREHHVSVSDSITLPKNSPSEISFSLHAGLKPVSRTPIVRIVKQSAKQGDVPRDVYTVQLPQGLRTFVVTYEGEIFHPVRQRGKEQARGIDETPGIISDEGVFLSANSAWYPDPGPGLITFDLEVKLPASWDAVSQGERTFHDHGGNATFVRWRSREPQEEIFLIAAQFTEYTKPGGIAQSMVFLRTPDEALANKYLDATAGYLAMYSSFIGPYPYKKFALVENFWETGFGMPSFTLLGSRVIRLPFIINSSYPHEILHNWWGNSVFPDYEQGNWSEGITAYLADHLIKEQQGSGSDYRVNTLQKYADYVLGARDFPLTRFRSRHSSSSEAIGYGKSLMFFHMLRHELGDAVFKQGLQEFYKQYKYVSTTFNNIRTSFEAVSNRDLKPLFDQWIARTGAPQLKVGNARVTTEGSGFVLSAAIEQTQPGDVYLLKVPVAVTMEGQEQTHQAVLDMTGKTVELRISLPARPIRLDVDPEFDLFRRLDREEIPPAATQALGAKKMLIILPSGADAKLLEAYRSFAAGLGKSGPDEIEVKLDSAVGKLPIDRAITILGWENSFTKGMTDAMTVLGVAVSNQSVRINQTDIPRRNHSFVLSTRIPGNPGLGMLFIAADTAGALPGLGQKLPHYHRYSYLAFEGQEPANVAKGRWPVVNSPLTVFFPDKNGAQTRSEIGKLVKREPLASLTPVFSHERMKETIAFLSSEALAGRGFGSPGLEKSADYIAQKFREAGLTPAGDGNAGWFQTWEDEGGDPPQKAVMKNVIGVLPGKRPESSTHSVVVGAHYDHLGYGWPETRDTSKGKVHPGADDNASGVAVLIELARVLSKEPKPDKTIVFIAFTGEEAGRRGSKHYLAAARQYPADKCIGMINLDTVGRLGKRKLLVLGAGSAREWVHIFRGAGFVTGVEVETVSEELDSSDQKSFQEAGVPAVQLFSGPHLDYHRSTDTADKIDADGLVKVAAVAKEAIEYLAERKEPLTSGTQRPKEAGSGPKGERKVGLGTIPDFAYSDKGFRLSGVVPGSPAEKAGLKEGDVIVQLNNSAIGSLKDYSNILKTLKPGDRASIMYLRNGREMSVELVVTER